MHYWGDDNVDWTGINAAAEYIGLTLRRWGRVSVWQYKEKFGTVCVYCVFGWCSLHSIVYQGYAFNQFPGWLWRLDCWLSPAVRLFLWDVGLWFHKWFYRRTYREAVRRWPHLRREILCCADYHELLKGL